MYISIHGHPFPQIATMEKTFIPEPLLPCNDECLVALLPLDKGTVVMVAIQQDEIEHIHSYANSQKLDKDNIDWVVVDRETFEDAMMAHMKEHLAGPLNEILQSLNLHNEE